MTSKQIPQIGGSYRPAQHAVQYGVRLRSGQVVACADRAAADEFLAALSLAGAVLVQRSEWTPVEDVAVQQREERAVAEARPHDEGPIRPLDKDCSRGAFLRLECDLQLDGTSVLSLHKVGSDVHLRIWHAGSEQYAVAVLDRKYRRDVAHALTEFDTSEADRG